MSHCIQVRPHSGRALVTESVQDFLDEELEGDANEELQEETKEELPRGLKW